MNLFSSVLKYLDLLKLIKGNSPHDLEVWEHLASKHVICLPEFLEESLVVFLLDYARYLDRFFQ